MKFKFHRKKLTFRRFSYYLLIATIVISCITNGIFAKFTTENYGGDGARVAKFGVIVSISGDLFSSVYNTKTDADITDGEEILLKPEDSNNPTIIKADDNVVSVRASINDDGTTYDNIIAPGTKNDVGVSISVTGTPETDYDLSYVLSNFQTVALYGGIAGTTYGLMVPFDSGVVNDTNFKELVENEIYTSSDQNDGTGTYQKYTKVATDAEFDNSAQYYKLKDTVKIEGTEIYMPIKYYITDKTDEDNRILLNPSYRVASAFDTGITGLYASFAANTFDGCGSAGVSVGHIGEALGSKIYETGKMINEVFNFTWEWPYHQIENPQTQEEIEELAWCNACDTILGYIAAGKNVVKGINGEFDNNILNSDDIDGMMSGTENYNIDISFDYSVTVKQVD